MGQSKRPLLRNVATNQEHDDVLLASVAQNAVHVSAKSFELNNNVVDDTMTSSGTVTGISAHPADFRAELRWPDLIAQLFLHIGALYGIGQLFSVRWITIIWSEITNKATFFLTRLNGARRA